MVISCDRRFAVEGTIAVVTLLLVGLTWVLFRLAAVLGQSK
jgi:hypothetical protein